MVSHAAPVSTHSTRDDHFKNPFRLSRPTAPHAAPQTGRPFLFSSISSPPDKHYTSLSFRIIIVYTHTRFIHTLYFCTTIMIMRFIIVVVCGTTSEKWNVQYLDFIKVAGRPHTRYTCITFTPFIPYVYNHRHFAKQMQTVQ